MLMPAFRRNPITSASRRVWFHPACLNLRANFLSVRRYSEALARANGSSTTKVEKIILDNIKTMGPMSFATYMQLCLSHPTEGYYMNPSNAVIGSEGDFITSPEISQVFGELFGIWLVSQWMSVGQTPGIRLVELGPGKGTLMDDILRVVSQFPSSRSALKRVHLVETSPAMRALQNAKLQPSAQENGWELFWHDSIDDIPQDSSEYTMFVAHEFFDVLPIHIVEKTHKGWQEVLIASSPDPAAPTVLTSPSPLIPPTGTSLSHTRLRHVLSPSPTPSSTLLGVSSPRFQTLPIGSRVEVSPTAFKIARKVGELLSAKNEGTVPGGSGLIIDYGGDQAFGNSFRAFKDHKVLEVFHRPGECDLTANVDFAYLKEAISDLVTTHGPLLQATFLGRMGLQLRIDALKYASKTEQRKNAIEEAAKRLVDLTGMGKEYQVLGITSGGNDQDTWPFMSMTNE